MSLETGPLIGHDSIMCKDQEYVKNYTYDLISHVLYQCAFLTLTVYNSKANEVITFIFCQQQDHIVFYLV